MGDSPCPEARQLLAQLEGQQGFRRALACADAEKALDAGDLDKAASSSRPPARRRSCSRPCTTRWRPGAPRP